MTLVSFSPLGFVRGKLFDALPRSPRADTQTVAPQPSSFYGQQGSGCQEALLGLFTLVCIYTHVQQPDKLGLEEVLFCQKLLAAPPVSKGIEREGFQSSFGVER